MSVKEKMTVSRGLSEIKRINKVIDEALSVRQGKFIGVTVGRDAKKKIPGSSLSPEKASEMIVANFNMFNTNFNRRTAIKTAIVESNAKTMIKFQGKDISVAAAIELRANLDPLRKYCNIMSEEFVTALRQVEDINSKLAVKINQLAAEATRSLNGAAEQNVEVMQAAIKNVRDSIEKSELDSQEASLIDPCIVELHIKILREKINAIDCELDHILNESNATTIIEFEYDN